MKFKYYLSLLLSLVTAMTASAISGDYSDPGGGTYWCNVYVHDIAASKSYGWCTGDSEDGKMNEFRGFECSNNGKVTTQNPWMFFKFRYNKGQSKDYKYKSSNQQVYVMLKDGSLHQIVDAAASWSQTDKTWGLVNCSWDGEWFYVRYAPNERGMKEVSALQVESDSYYYQSNFWHRDYWFYIHARYLKGIDFSEMSRAREAKIEWTAPDKVKVSADNSWLPSQIGNGVSNFSFNTVYDATVYTPANGKVVSTARFRATNRGTGSTELKVPMDQDFEVRVTRNTQTSFTFEVGGDVSQSLNEGATQSTSFVNKINRLTASFNQVEGTTTLSWEDSYPSNQGEYQIYRTLLSESGDLQGNRELLGTTKNKSYTDNSSRGLEYGKYYRYEVFMKKNSWGNIDIPSNPEALTVVNATEVRTNTVPVIPMHLVQDMSATDDVQVNWTFGNVPKSENDITFKVHRIEPGGAVTRNYTEVTVSRNAGKASFTDDKPASACSLYGYFVQVDLADNKVHLYSDTIYAHVLGVSAVTAVDATKGTAGTEVVIKWKARQVGTKPTLYDVQRRYIGSDDWISIYEEEDTKTTYTYTDKTAEPCRYYEYRVIAYGEDCDGGGRVIGNTMRDVGFSRASGVISGRVQFEGGTAVGDVRVSLSRESDARTGAPYHSRAVLEKGDALRFTNLGGVVNDHKPFTLQMFVRPDSVAETMTLMSEPVQLDLRYNKSKALYDLLLEGTVAGGIPAGQFSQVSLLCDGNKVTTYTAGNQMVANEENVSATPNYIEAFFKTPLMDESGASLDGWELSDIGRDSNYGWKIIDGAFASSHQTITASKEVSVSSQMVGYNVKASVEMSAPMGAKAALVTVTMTGGGHVDQVTVCDDKTEHSEWQTYSVEFTIPEWATLLTYTIEARDSKSWSGYYGPRFKNMKMEFSGADQFFDGNDWVLLPDFTGNVDEVRVWNRVLTTNEITADVDRLISGESDGLKSYITFDEGLEEYAFDSSCTNGQPNGNHVTLGANTRPSDVIPTGDQLSAYGMTNDKGEYEIRGIPFAGSGTRYSVYPTKGIHAFNPTSRSAFIGGTSMTINNADFTDVSSFKVRGTIRYSGTTIPVDSVSFYVDGVPCNKNDQMIVTDENGEYEIQVPIGSHYIEARRTGHTFEGAGRYPAKEIGTYEFLEDTHIDFFDNTLAIVAGRVVGGETEGKKPLGYGASENNIGKAVITLSPLDHPQRMINAVQHVEGTTTEWVPNSANLSVASAADTIKSVAYRAGGSLDDAKLIVITTDEKTGEFSALIPPIRYKVESVKFPNNAEVERDEMFGSVPAIDLRNPNDTIRPDTMYTADKKPLPLFKCNKKMLLTYRSQPVIDITQQGAPAGAFGTDTIVVRDAGKDVKLPIYSYDETTGKVTYNYGYPIFQMSREYSFNIHAYEPYVNYDTDKAGRRYEDALADSIITFDNELGNGAIIAAKDTITPDGHELKRGEFVRLTAEQVKLDSIGKGVYKWRAGIPSLTAPYTRNMNASTVINKTTRLWRNDQGLNAIITGVVPTGNNFITAGPNRVQMVLRDPPGDASSTTWATDSVTCDYTYTVRGVHNNTELGVDIRTSIEFDILTGTAFFGKLTYNTVIGENQVSWKYDVNKTWDNHTSVTYTNSKSTSTSSSNVYVGRDGDVFIGYSTNYIIGAADKVGLFKDDSGNWRVSMEETMAMDEKFNTHFEFSQKYIETTLFDNIKRTRNSMLKHITSAAEIEENPAVPTYYTYLPSTDAKFGSLNSDKDVWGAEAKDGFDGPSYWARFPEGYEGCDSVRWCNEIVDKWKQKLADNEEDKLKAFGDAKTYKLGNESFERGVTVTNSTGSSSKEVHNSTEVFSTGLAYRGKNGYLLDKMGAIIISNTDIGYHQTKYDVDETTANERFSYTLNDTQRGNSHTVDIYRSPNNWGPIFRTRGGQTRCPYEGETKTKYYRPGQTLDYATMKLDNPKISMPVRNLVDIPAGQEAHVQVVFNNESEVHEELSPVFLMVKTDSNPNGLQIFMDGQSLLNGTELWLPYGVPLTKTLTIKQSDNSILDYNDITLVIANTCNPALWTFGEVSFSAHFVPAAPAITLKLNKNILNERAVQSGEQLNVTIGDINRMFSGLKGVRLKYRFAGDAQWVTAHEWLTDAKYYTDGHESDTQSMLPDDQPDIVYNLELPSIDGNYIVAAESICLFGKREYTNQTPEQSVIRDTRGPKLLGQAYPNSGLLTPTDDICIRFNEAIRESYLTKDTNFFITGSLNDSQVNHDVSLQFNGNSIETEAYLPITNTSFSGSLWFKRQTGGSLIEHGTEGNHLSLSINDSGNVVADINGTTATSAEAVPADKWLFLAFNYVKGATAGDNTLTMLVAEDDKETMLFDELAVPDYDNTGRITLGRGYTGTMQELTLWNKNTPVRTLLGQKDEVVASYMPGLVGYWKMDEGHGTLVTDHARGRNIHLPSETWNIENSNLAAHLDGERSIKIPIGSISPRPTDSYVMEMWFRGEKDKNARATLFSVTDRVSLGFDVDNSLVLQVYDKEENTSLDTNGLPIILTDVNYNDGNWHHFALNVRRGVGAVAYVDGGAVKTIPEQTIPEPSGDYIYIGSMLKRHSPSASPIETFHFTGDIDEIRFWNVATDGTSLIANMYNQVDTAKVAGLIAYYPMEHSRLDANNKIVKEFSLDNAAPGEHHITTPAALGDGVTQAATAPALRTAPLKQNLDFDFVASSNEIYINLKTLPAKMQGNLLTFTVKNVRDMQDNLSETITWSAEVDYRTLVWAQSDGLEIHKGRLYESRVNTILRNKGRATENFTITGLPSWVTINTPSGVLGINESTEIEFVIGANAPLGRHVFYVYAVNDDDISTPLPVSVYVWGNGPSWSVNPRDYESSMNFVGQIYFDDKICSNPNTVIAAFVSGECLGVAEPKLVSTRDAYFVNLTVYGYEDITKNEPVVFRIYDADRGVVLSDVKAVIDGKTYNVTYHPNGVIGSYDNPVKWVTGDRVEQSLDLATGWNWISLYTEPEKKDLESVFGHSRSFNTIKSKEGFAMNSGTVWQQSGLESVDVGNLYKVKVKIDLRHAINGTAVNPATMPQTIRPGWNWIGPISIYNLSLQEAFADLNPTRGDMVKSKEAVAFYDGYKWEGELTALIPGQGYYYRSLNPEDVTFHYPVIDSHSEMPVAPLRAPLRSIFNPVDHHQFSDNMNVVARVMVDGEKVDTLTVASFILGECRSVGRATPDGYYMLTVPGNANESSLSASFATVIDGKQIPIEEKLPWGSDIIHGDLDNPVLFHVKTTGVNDIDADSDGIIITPTVVRDVVNVRSGSLLGVVAVYSAGGACVARQTNINDNVTSLSIGDLPAGVYFVEAIAASGNRVVKRVVKQ